MKPLQRILINFGCAPGNYMFKCQMCLETGIGDKRSSTCHPCALTLAIKMATRALNELAAQATYLAYLQKRFRTEAAANPDFIELPVVPVYTEPEELLVALKVEKSLVGEYAEQFETFLFTSKIQDAVEVYVETYGKIFDCYTRTGACVREDGDTGTNRSKNSKSNCPPIT